MNKLGQSGYTSVSNHSEWHEEQYKNKAEAFGWNTLVISGHSIEEIVEAFGKAKHSDKPMFIIAKTFKGEYCGETVKDTNGWHGKPLSNDTFTESIERLSGLVDNTLENRLKTFVPQEIRHINKHINYEVPNELVKKVSTRKAFGDSIK